ncbi:hypothetical protein PAXRUDRAFT_44226, partial [Paxillus rubicundulus Ve08.2h10]
PAQLVLTETALMQSIHQLESWNRIFGEKMTLDAILDPPEEREVGQTGGLLNADNDEAIMVEVHRQMAVESGEIIEVESDHDNDDNDNVGDGSLMSRADVIAMCQQLEDGCMQFGDAELSFDLASHLRTFHIHLQREDLLHSKQTSLDQYF